MTATTAKYEIPAQLLTQTLHPGVILHKGIYVNTVCCGEEYTPDNSLCVFCDGGREVTCAECEGDGALEDDTDCVTCAGAGTTRCPQARNRWAHE
ncbi:hypothetical protein [Frankia sp. Cr1]|uniref:hypothetical protein n=1 Tax=Frankia sp. Cr1 TaxID=3073931 RepID=UPI002AD2C21C|nr:hypothetical protein [Frankia sp. Cr1]